MKETKDSAAIPPDWSRAVPAPEALAPGENLKAGLQAGPNAQPNAKKVELSSLYWGIFVLFGAGMLFGLGAAVKPALETAAAAPCRAMSPAMTDREAPDLELVDREGKPVKLSDSNGRFRVINFWATWCEPCLDEWPDLDRLASRVQGKEDIEVWAVSIDEDQKAIDEFLRSHALEGTKVRVLRDPKKEAHKLFGSEKIPDTYFVDANQRIRSIFVNLREWGKPEAQRCVEETAARPPAR